MSGTTDGLRLLADDPFGLLQTLDGRLQRARLDRIAGRADRWTGLSLRLAGRDCLVPQREIREVIVRPQLTRIPNARPWLLGLANVRGSLLTLLDPALLAGLPAAAPTRHTRVAVLNSERESLGFVVDEVHGYRSFSVADQSPATESDHEDAFASCRLGGFERDGQRWTVISFMRLLQLPQARQAGW